MGAGGKLPGPDAKAADASVGDGAAFAQVGGEAQQHIVPAKLGQHAHDHARAILEHDGDGAHEVAGDEGEIGLPREYELTVLEPAPLKEIAIEVDPTVFKDVIPYGFQVRRHTISASRAQQSSTGGALPPGALATLSPAGMPPGGRSASGLTVVGSRSDDSDWRVLVLMRSERGELAEATLSPRAARQAAKDLTAMADLLESGWKA